MTWCACAMRWCACVMCWCACVMLEDMVCFYHYVARVIWLLCNMFLHDVSFLFDVPLSFCGVPLSLCGVPLSLCGVPLSSCGVLFHYVVCFCHCDFLKQLQRTTIRICRQHRILKIWVSCWRENLSIFLFLVVLNNPFQWPRDCIVSDDDYLLLTWLRLMDYKSTLF